MTAAPDPDAPDRQTGVLVGVDGSDASMVALDWAAHCAAQTGRNLTICHVSPGVEKSAMPVEPLLTEEYAERGKSILEKALVRAREAEPSLPAETHLAFGQPTAELRQSATDMAMVVVGRHGSGWFHRAIIGSVSTQLTAHAPRPVVVTRSTPVSNGGPVVVGVDDSPHAQAALEFAFDQAARLTVDLIALHVYTVPGPIVHGDLPPLPDVAGFRRNGATELLDDLVNPLVATYPDVVVRRELTVGSAAHELVERSAGASLLVVGARGQGGFRGLLMGSVSQHVVSLAECPVAVAR